MKEQSDILEAFEIIQNSMYVPYKGVLLEWLVGGYRWLGKDYTSLQAIDEEMDKIAKIIEKSIKK